MYYLSILFRVVNQYILDIQEGIELINFDFYKGYNLYEISCEDFSHKREPIMPSGDLHCPSTIHPIALLCYGVVTKYLISYDRGLLQFRRIVYTC